MTTVAITTTSLPATQLAEILDETIPHMYERENMPILSAIHLDSDGTHLHAVGTDRYTMAIARRPLYSGEPWTATVGAAHITYLQSWADAHGRKDTAHLAASPGELTVTSNQGRITLPTITGNFPAWRPLFRQHLDHPVEPMELSGLDTQYLRRWEKAGRRLRFAQAGAEKPLIVFGDNFLGMQMGMRWTDGTTRDTLTAAWAPSLGIDTGDEPAELPLPDPTNAIPEMTRDLLHRVTLASQELYEACGPSDPAAMAAHALSGANAWISYRLLQALRVADPQLAESVIENLHDELDAGDFAETAYDDAEKTGHDPEQWVEDFKAARKRRAGQAAKDAAEQQPTA